MNKLLKVLLVLLFGSLVTAQDMPDKTVPVVLVHGILAKRSVFWKMELRFERDGYTCYNYGYPSVKKTIEEHGQDFAAWVDSTLGDREFYLISHSMGNLVCREAFAGHPDLKIKRWVMLAPPNRGAQVADIWSNIRLYEWITRTPGQELRYSLADHFRNMPPPDCEFGIIAGGLQDGKGYNPLLDGDNDGEVRVSETYLDGALDHIILQHMHTSLLMFQDTYLQILHFLATGKFLH